MAKVAILFIVAFVPSLQAGLLEHLTSEVENLKTIQEDLKRNQEDLKSNEATKNAEIEDLKSKIARLSKKGAQCGVQERWNSSSSTITYEASNALMVNSGSGSLDTATGVWTAEDSGIYLVTWSLRNHIPPVGTKDNWIFLSKNGVKLWESLHGTFYTGELAASINEHGGRTLLLDLLKGDNLKLITKTITGSVDRITFCVSLQSAS